MTVRWGIATPGPSRLAVCGGVGTRRRRSRSRRFASEGARPISAIASRSRIDTARTTGCWKTRVSTSCTSPRRIRVTQPTRCCSSRAGKHVLCEKPFALNATQANEMIEAAEAQQRFLMEAMWSRFLPAYRVAARPARRRAHRRAAPRRGELRLACGGGPDPSPVRPRAGRWCTARSRRLHGQPQPVRARAGGSGRRRGHVGETGVDEHVAAVLQHADDRLGVVQAATARRLTCTARIAGTEGLIDLPAFMHCPTRRRRGHGQQC